MFWKTNMPSSGRYKADTLVQAMQVVHELATGDAQTTLENFDGYEGLDAVMVNAAAKACASALGMKFTGIGNLLGSTGRPVNILPGRKDGVDLLLTIRCGYRFIDMNNAATFVRVFGQIHDNLRAAIRAKYPNATVSLSHNGAYKNAVTLNLTVNVVPKMAAMKVAA